jgi:hypothetical protein
MAGFPSRTQLWNGAMLHTIAHALWISETQNDYGVEWDSQSYLRNNGSGDYAAITFSDHLIVGVFFGHESNRSPFGYRHENPGYNYRPYFIGAPQAVVAFAERHTLQYRFEDLNGHLVGPVITAAFWGERDGLTAAESWDDVWKHGADILGLEVITDIDAAFAYVEENYEYSDQQLAIIRAIYKNFLSPDVQFDGTALRQYFNADGLALLEAVSIRL